ncbi:UTRA domain-containing protein [Oceanobacillus sp. 143]|uniref:GntR family transcriptional regulator n=1 Tax=Oceanobacillus zhaokaii TaxID=2052660 RepID=A0A345PLJ6_9BACI|nr:GntR family transcriptional regulator [Oceanobacillus zhaokaii]AXI10876.1 GntR family transcriptional regulator [Oceanobacillus zhaokaii]QGS69740.1 UTRA domain-containing protein [Oceanobacillus sp. 143]
MSIDKENQITDDIMDKIVKGEIGTGEKLPSENELADKYRVPRMTVRHALLKLEERGYIYSKQGKGRYVKEAAIPIQLSLTGKISFTEKMNQLGFELKTSNIYCEKIDYDAEVYRILGTARGEAVFKIGRLRVINGEPIAIHNSYVSESSFPKIEEEGPAIQSMFSYYRKQGFKEFSSRQTMLSITFPTSKEQRLLSCKSMVPLIKVESDCIDAESKQILEHTKILYRSDKFKYDITMD